MGIDKAAALADGNYLRPVGHGQVLVVQAAPAGEVPLRWIAVEQEFDVGVVPWAEQFGQLDFTRP